MLTRLIKPILALAFLAGMLVLAANPIGTGTIKGVVRDSGSGQPVVGASVLIKGTKIGSMTDPNGFYEISRLTPGTYTVVISSVEYNTVEFAGIVVVADSIKQLDAQVAAKVTQLDKMITVTADKDIINRYEAASQTAMRAQTIKARPVQSVDKLLRSVAGVQATPSGQVYIRGGRAGEVSYIVDGVPLGDPLGCFSQKYIGTTPVCTFPPSHGGTAIVNGEPFDAMFFKHYGVNPFVDAEDDHFSTFAIDVDDASYIMMRSYLERGALPPAEAVRAEEFINHFKYTYVSPEHEAFSIGIAGAPTPFAPANVRLLRIGINGFAVRAENRKPANLVFVIDISGSMGIENRLGLVKKALRLLVDELTDKDRVGIVVFGSEGRVVLEPTSIADRDHILDVIDALATDGATNAEEGIRLGYQMADQVFEKGKINRIVLCSDGVANVGVTGPDAILSEIKKYARKGITLSTVGFGMENYNDILMEQLGDKGEGHYAYVDNLQEAKRVFVDNLTGTLQVIARDVKIQVDFNPAVVRSYRLIGYENRDVADEDFRNDTVDGGEIGSAHQVTALYEMKLLAEAKGNLGTVSVRYKDPESKQVTEVSREIGPDVFAGSFDQAEPSLKLAACAAQFAEILRKSYWAKGETIDSLLAQTSALYAESKNSETLDLMGLMNKARKFKTELAVK